jgi:hypothetical protein
MEWYPTGVYPLPLKPSGSFQGRAVARQQKNLGSWPIRRHYASTWISGPRVQRVEANYDYRNDNGEMGIHYECCPIRSKLVLRRDTSGVRRRRPEISGGADRYYSTYITGE